MASKTTLSYLGFDFDIGTKNPQHITLFFETAPNLPDVIAYLKENYGNVNATASKPFQSPYHWVTSAEVKHMEKQQDELKSQKIEYTFIPKPQKEVPRNTFTNFFFSSSCSLNCLPCLKINLSKILS